jgi:hypothetical protein
MHIYDLVSLKLFITLVFQTTFVEKFKTYFIFRNVL